MNKPIIRTKRLVLVAGSTIATGDINIPEGYSVFAGATAKNDQNALIRLGLSENGQKIHDPLALSWWDGQLGTFQQRSRLLGYNGGTTLTAEVTTAKALDQDVEIEVAFEIWQQPVWQNGPDGTVIPGSC